MTSWADVLVRIDSNGLKAELVLWHIVWGNGHGCQRLLRLKLGSAEVLLLLLRLWTFLRGKAAAYYMAEEGGFTSKQLVQAKALARHWSAR